MINMSNPKEILNEFKWSSSYSLDKVEIWYIHRGAPNDTKIISAINVLKFEKSFMKTKSSMIPYHRIFKIIYDKKVVFKR